MDFVKRNKLEQLKEVEDKNDEYYSNLIVDFEDLFTAMENSYKEHLLEIIIHDNPITDFEKAHLMFFILFQMMRNPKSLGKFIEINEEKGIEKFEVFYQIRNILSDRTELSKLTAPFVVPTWNIYKIKKKQITIVRLSCFDKRTKLNGSISTKYFIGN